MKNRWRYIGCTTRIERNMSNPLRPDRRACRGRVAVLWRPFGPANVDRVCCGDKNSVATPLIAVSLVYKKSPSSAKRVRAENRVSAGIFRSENPTTVFSARYCVVPSRYFRRMYDVDAREHRSRSTPPRAFVASYFKCHVREIVSLGTLNR